MTDDEQSNNTITPNSNESAPDYAHAPLAAAAQGRGRDFDKLAGVLGAWLAGRVGADGPALLTDLRHPVGAGTSSETILASASWTQKGLAYRKDIVFRVQPNPDHFQLFRDPKFETQFRVLDVLHKNRLVRVPEPLFFEEDASILGLPFFAMSQLRGHVPVSSPPYNLQGWLFDATPRQRRVAWTTAMHELCRIAVVPVPLVSFLAKPELGSTGLEQQLEYWRRSIDWSTGNKTPDFLWALHAWLQANLPADRPDGLAWEDPRIGNMMFDDDFQLVGVMDWEQASLGGIRQDLGWWLFFDHFHAEGRGIRRLDGLGSRKETIELWEELVGEVAGDLLWYEVFAGFKVGLLTIRTYLLMGYSGVLPLKSNQALARACELADISVSD